MLTSMRKEWESMSPYREMSAMDSAAHYAERCAWQRLGISLDERYCGSFPPVPGPDTRSTWPGEKLIFGLTDKAARDVMADTAQKVLDEKQLRGELNKVRVSAEDKDKSNFPYGMTVVFFDNTNNTSAEELALQKLEFFNALNEALLTLGFKDTMNAPKLLPQQAL